MKEKNKNESQIKIFNVRLPKDLWKFIKTVSCESEVSMSDLCLEAIQSYRNKYEKKHNK